MQILSFKLAAFGPFTEKTLDFSQQPNALHLIYGPNEAGKSTFRRAIIHFLFGIPERTSDAHFHPMDKLRIGAYLTDGQGQVLGCYRRKGRKNTLLNFENQILEESALQHFLGNMTETRFNALFAFDHLQLRQGADELLRGGGNVGESLFQAGFGNLPITEILTQLDKEAEELFKARGSKPLLNQTLRTYKEATQSIKNHALSSQHWTEYTQKLSQQQQLRQELAAQLAQLRQAQNHLKRVQRIYPLLKKYHELQAHVQGLAAVQILPDEMGDRYLETRLTLQNALVQETQSKQDSAKLEAQLQTVILAPELLAQKVTIDNLRGRLGSHQKAAQDLPGVRTELRSTEAELHNLLRRIYPHLDLKDLPTVQLPIHQQERIKQLADQFPRLQEKQKYLAQRSTELSEQLAKQQHLLADLPDVPNLAPLQAALNRILKQGDVEENLDKIQQEIQEIKLVAELGLKQLGLWTGNLQDLLQAALPTLERIDYFERRFLELEQDRQRIKERLLENRQQLQRVTQKINALCWNGEVPTEASLAESRRLRQKYWQMIKLSPQLNVLPKTDENLYQSFENAMIHADELADRLRREAQRVAEYGLLLAEQQSAQQEQVQHTKKWHVLEELLANLQQEWDSCWQPLGIKPWTPAEMRLWLGECDRLRQQLERLDERQRTFSHQQHRLQHWIEELQQLLSTLPHTVMSPRLSDLVTQSQLYLDQANQSQQQRSALAKEVNNLILNLRQVELERQQAEENLEDWQQTWGQLLLPLQLPADTVPEVVKQVLAILEQVSNKLEKVNGLQRRVDLMHRDAELFHDEVLQLIQVLAPELSKMPVEQSVLTLVARLSQAEQETARSEQLQRQWADEQQRCQTAVHQVQVAQAHLQVLLEQAHCQDPELLNVLIDRSRHKKQLQQELVKTEQHLFEQGEGLSINELEAMIAAIEIESVPEQLRSYTEQVQHLEQQASEFDQQIGELKTLIKQMDGNAKAAEAANEAQWALTEIETLSERYMQVYLAALVLRKSMEQYQERHQGPLLSKTSQLFKQITLGKFSGVRAEYQDHEHPVLLGIRSPDQQGIQIHNLSEGSRDQLYLALRLSSIEYYQQQHPALPLILDDILINFDDERAQATFKVLGELAASTQIFFLTHHQHYIQLAQQSLSKQQLRIHQL